MFLAGQKNNFTGLGIIKVMFSLKENLIQAGE
jgi:hypothetical protein